jgi:hypothetical protein
MSLKKQSLSFVKRRKKKESTALTEEAANVSSDL